jgi:hypothetical protein
VHELLRAAPLDSPRKSDAAQIPPNGIIGISSTFDEPILQVSSFIAAEYVSFKLRMLKDAARGFWFRWFVPKVAACLFWREKLSCFESAALRTGAARTTAIHAPASHIQFLAVAIVQAPFEIRVVCEIINAVGITFRPFAAMASGKPNKTEQRKKQNCSSHGLPFPAFGGNVRMKQLDLMIRCYPIRISRPRDCTFECLSALRSIVANVEGSRTASSRRTHPIASIVRTRTATASERRWRFTGGLLFFLNSPSTAENTTHSRLRVKVHTIRFSHHQIFLKANICPPAGAFFFCAQAIPAAVRWLKDFFEAFTVSSLIRFPQEPNLPDMCTRVR